MEEIKRIYALTNDDDTKIKEVRAMSYDVWTIERRYAANRYNGEWNWKELSRMEYIGDNF